MKRADLIRLFEEARRLIQHHEYVVIGSLSILGLDEHTAIPGDMSLSIDVDAYTRSDPGRIFDLQAPLGEGSPFHAGQGYFLDPVSPQLATLPDGWEARLLTLDASGLRLHFLDPHDAAVSKLARGEPRDMRWVRAGIAAALISLPIMRARLAHTHFLDEEEARRAQAALAQCTIPSIFGSASDIAGQ